MTTIADFILTIDTVYSTLCVQYLVCEDEIKNLTQCAVRQETMEVRFRHDWDFFYLFYNSLYHLVSQNNEKLRLNEKLSHYYEILSKKFNLVTNNNGKLTHNNDLVQYLIRLRNQVEIKKPEILT